MAKFSVEIIVDTDPDGEQGRPLFSPGNLMVILPYISKIVRDIASTPTGKPPSDFNGAPPSSDDIGQSYGAGSSAQEVLRDLERSAAQAVAKETQENG